VDEHLTRHLAFLSRGRYRDLNKQAFMDQARKLIPSVTDDMVDESFVGVMSQVCVCVRVCVMSCCRGVHGA
jgi:hypothetical protein